MGHTLVHELRTDAIQSALEEQLELLGKAIALRRKSFGRFDPDFVAIGIAGYANAIVAIAGYANAIVAMARGTDDR